MKLELTIKTDYVPGWSAFDGVRELIQNARDAEIEFNARMEVDHYDGRILRIENDGVTLPHEALLLGHTTKKDRRDMAGQWGEGLKLGILALLRAGHSVKIRSGSEVWTPMIERSEKFDADVLKFDIATGREPKNRVRIEVEGISSEDWKVLKDRFLFLNKRQLATVETDHGTLLLGDKFTGALYVKGIYVQHNPKLSYGYDLRDAELDRDRKMVDSWDLQGRTQAIWSAALSQRPDLFGDFFTMLEKRATDVEGLGWSSNALSSVPGDVVDYVVGRFKERHGNDAVPVESFGESKDVAHLGKVGVVTPKPLAAILSRVMGDLQALKAKLREEVTKSYSWAELSTTEQQHLEQAVALVNSVEPLTLDDVEIVDVRSLDLEGLFKDGRILLTKKVLSSADKTLEVAVHETAHRAGGDGEKSHVAQIERLWSGIVSGLRKRP